MKLISAVFADAKCIEPMGVQNGQLNNQQITASSYNGYNLNPHKARLNGSAAWSSSILDNNQFLEVAHLTDTYLGSYIQHFD